MLKSAFNSFLASRAAAVVLAAALALPPAAAQDTPELFEYMAVVDISRIFRDSAFIKQNRDEISASFAERDDNLRALIDEAEAKRESLSRERLSLTEADFAAQRQEIEQLDIRIQREDRNLREDRRLAFDARQRELEKIVLTAVQDLSRERGYYVVLELSAILFAEQSVDFTADVIAKLDSEQPSVQQPDDQ